MSAITPEKIVAFFNEQRRRLQAETGEEYANISLSVYGHAERGTVGWTIHANGDAGMNRDFDAAFLSAVKSAHPSAHAAALREKAAALIVEADAILAKFNPSHE